VKPRTKWSIVWAGWAGYFAVAEYVALKSAEADAPLSSHLRGILGIRSVSRHRRMGQLAFVSGTVWLLDHLYREVKP
jgi:hypothetical protein